MRRYVSSPPLVDYVVHSYLIRTYEKVPHVIPFKMDKIFESFRKENGWMTNDDDNTIEMRFQFGLLNMGGSSSLCCQIKNKNEYVALVAEQSKKEMKIVVYDKIGTIITSCDSGLTSTDTNSEYEAAIINFAKGYLINLSKKSKVIKEQKNENAIVCDFFDERFKERVLFETDFSYGILELPYGKYCYCCKILEDSKYLVLEEDHENRCGNIVTYDFEGIIISSVKTNLKYDAINEDGKSYIIGVADGFCRMKTRKET